MKKNVSNISKRFPWLIRLLVLSLVVAIYSWALRGLQTDFALFKWSYVTDFYHAFSHQIFLSWISQLND